MAHLRDVLSLIYQQLIDLADSLITDRVWGNWKQITGITPRKLITNNCKIQER